ncbi:E3 ubiquitin-protein ligase TRIM56 [Patella vulgata]|uniref:E3 ubiquitin-protein ligase TRIM56 n=1 Tax=Patella vulgata TaxID=6465 RepID=UPI00217F89E8|nr:E3 ubiquitin-protein ligase TRIM56 [Patella vulgata]XP_050394206.1 E3 ubiquitin-protein ligase TRIM56 [Patella vulgata]XP_050394207.1 E3 ubiquitin-protein ligase TRIM56 [Patella vulgata]XP_050394208.1 E3 ubiquitin-protein ligase TRIM56 [Patella vulgata]XP_055954603.1 E3 ubiquitin-protein ligase TRIM56 [Patella vulgata]
MASHSNGPEFHLTCGLCAQDFDNPVTLKCLHSYCMGCIQKHICKTRDADSKGYFNCPVCHVPIEKPDRTIPASQWANKLPPSQFLKCLADAITGKSSGDLCSLCSQGKTTVQASLWCQNCHDGLCDACSDVHAKMKVSRNHTTVPIASVSKQERNKSGNPVCVVHPEHCVEFYCNHCCVVLCQTCAIVDHRKCGDIVSIAIVARQNRAELHQTLNEIKTYVTMDEKKKEDIQLHTLKLNDSKVDVETAIKQYVNDLITKLRQSEQELIKKFQVEYEAATVELTTREVNSKKTYTALKHVEKFIASVITMGSDADILNNARLIENQKQRLVDNQTEPVEKPICSDMKFVSDANLASLISCGYIGCIKPRTAYKVQKIETHLDGENKGESCAIDLTIVTIKEKSIPVVVDGTNNCVKMLSDPPHKISLRNPRRIAKLSNRTVIVTSSKHVSFIDVEPRFQVNKMVETQTDYTGIAVIGANRLAASRWSFSGGGFVDIVDFAGHVLLKLVLKDLLDPSYLSTTTTGNILVSDCRSKALTCLTQTGEVVFSYKSEVGDKLKLPYGVCTSKDGSIYLADYNGARVIKLGNNGEYLEDCLTKSQGIERPRGIAFDSSDHLYVCHCRGWINVFRTS